MIVVDTNTIAYFYLPTDYTLAVEELFSVDPEWVAPLLWRSELRNILALHLRKGLLKLDDALEIQNQAETLLATNEYEVKSTSVLMLAHSSGCTAYDCEFISLAKSLSTKLVTFDKKLIKAFPDVALSAVDFVSRRP